MTFLQLVQKLHREAGCSGSAPSAVTSQTGEAQRLVDWVNDAWEDIQNAHPNWKWMRSQARVSTSAGDREYEPGDFTDDRTSVAIENFGRWVPNTFSIYKNSLGQSDERELIWMPYDEWRRLYDFGADATAQDYPVNFTVDPTTLAVLLGKIPDTTYVVRGDFYHCASRMSANADVPGLPAQFHLAIVWRALMLYAEYESAPEAYGKGQSNFNRAFSRLELNQKPAMGFGPPLVC